LRRLHQKVLTDVSVEKVAYPEKAAPKWSKGRALKKRNNAQYGKMINMLTPIQIRKLASLLWPSDREMAVSPRWLFVRAGRLNETFVKNARIASEVTNDLQVVTVNGEAYVWPAKADIYALLTILCELKNSNHPHQYIYGNTKVVAGDVVVDIGACEGSFSAYAAGLGAEVIAVEPSQIMMRVINALFELRGLRKPTIANTLLGGEPQSLHFTDNPDNPGGSRVAGQADANSYPVPVTTLDGMVTSLGLKQVDFIKCDAEGADVGILKSGKKTLEKFHPKLAITTYHGTNDFLDLFSFLKPLGYKIEGKGLLYTNNEFRVLMLHAW